MRTVPDGGPDASPLKLVRGLVAECPIEPGAIGVLIDKGGQVRPQMVPYQRLPMHCSLTCKLRTPTVPMLWNVTLAD